MIYAEAIEDEGAFEKARRAWVKAAEEWREFGNQVIEHSTGVELRLGAEKDVEKVLNEMRAKLDAFAPGTREKVTEEKRLSLTPDERKLLDTPPAEVTPTMSEARYAAEQKVFVNDRNVAERIAVDAPEHRKEALQLANQIERQETLLNYTRNYKRDANYDYWQTRADFEQTTNALEARRLMLDARKAFEEADLIRAQRLYEEGFQRWRRVIDEFPSMLDDEAMTGEDIVEFIKKYRDVLDQLDETIGEDFPLWEVIEKFDREQNFTEELSEHRKKQGIQTPAAPGTATPAEPESAKSTEPAASEAEQPSETPEATPAAPEATPESPPAAQ
jgi:hypothetical protein